MLLVVGVVVWLSPVGNAAKAQGGGIVVHQGPVVQARAFNGNVRRLPNVPVVRSQVRPELEAPDAGFPKVGPAAPAIPTAPNMPSPSQSFAGLDYNTWGSGHPPDSVGDVGPNHYVQAVNTSIGFYSKTGTQQAALTFDTFFASSSAPCNNSNRGDPTVVYDPMADRWIIADFAWADTQNGPYYECIAVSQTGDPVSGGWYMYAVRTDDNAHPWLAEYPKMGIWPDGLYMTANMFDCLNADCSSSTYSGVRVWAFNRSELESGAPVNQVIADLPTSYFSLLPSNLRGDSPPAGRPNLLVSQARKAFAWEVWKFHVDWAVPANSTLNGPKLVSQTSYTDASRTVPSSGDNLDSLRKRAMMQNQYRNHGGVESIWVNHTVSTSSAGPTGIQWAQIKVTGGKVQTTPVQQQIYGNVGGDGVHRWLGSLAVDRDGDMALGYSASKSGMNPEIRYSGRLASDPLNTLAQGEATLQTGGGSQVGSSRWGDYSAMTVDPVDDCTFWYTNEYYATSGLDWQTRIGSFEFPSCTLPSADLEVAKSGPAKAAGSSDVVYSVKVTNRGPDDADAVELTDDVPTGSTFVSLSQTSGPAFGCSSPAAGGTGQISCTITTLASGASADFTIVVHPDAGTTSLTNTADVSSKTSDPGPSPNSDSVTTTIEALSITIVKHPPDPTTSTDAEFTLRVNDPNATVTCSLDGSDFSPCGLTVKYTGLKRGAHTFRAKAVRGTSKSVASWSWTIL
jgi:uncharacterized repeat protein (TIGR01451 family)